LPASTSDVRVNLSLHDCLGVQASWYLSPRRHVLEWFTVNALYLGTLFYLWRTRHGVCFFVLITYRTIVSALSKALPPPRQYELTLLDRVLGLAMIVTFAVVAFYKIMDN